MSSCLLKRVQAGFARPSFAILKAKCRSMAINSKALKYTARGESVVLHEEVESLPDTPTGSQALIRFMASPISRTDFLAIQSNGAEKASVDVSTKKIRFVTAQQVKIPATIGPVGALPKLPAFAGIEGVAEVEAVGPNVKGLKRGDWVLASPSVGSWRTHALAGESELTPVASDIPLEYAANLGISPLAALRLIEDFVPLKEGDVVIHNAANGLVGQSFLQIAAARGLKVVSIIRSRSLFNHMSQYLKNLGASIVAPYEILRTTQFKEVLDDLGTPKVAFDGVGGNYGSRMARLMPSGSTVVTYANPTGPLVLPSEKKLQVKGLFLSEWIRSKPQEHAKAVASLADMVREGKLQLLLERTKFDYFQHTMSKGMADPQDRRITMVF